MRQVPGAVAGTAHGFAVQSNDPAVGEHAGPHPHPPADLGALRYQHGCPQPGGAPLALSGDSSRDGRCRWLSQHHHVAQWSAPVLLLTRARVAPLVFIADLAGYFTAVSAVSLITLGARGQIPHSILWPALPLFVAAGLFGNVGGLWIAHRLPVRAFRSAVIVLVIVAGAVTALSG